MRGLLTLLLAASAATYSMAQRQGLPLLPTGPQVGVVYGQGADSNTTNRDFDEMVKAGAGTIACIFDWSEIEPVSGPALPVARSGS
jgi:hypothetical protein